MPSDQTTDIVDRLHALRDVRCNYEELQATVLAAIKEIRTLRGVEQMDRELDAHMAEGDARAEAAFRAVREASDCPYTSCRHPDALCVCSAAAVAALAAADAVDPMRRETGRQ